MSNSTEVKSANSPALTDDNRCRHISATGRRCRMPRGSTSSAYCTPHSQMEQQYLNAEAAARELLGTVDSFQTAIEVNEALGRLFRLTAQNRIPPRNAAILAYIGQLLLQSIDNVGQELYRVIGSSGREDLMGRALEKLEQAKKR